MSLSRLLVVAAVAGLAASPAAAAGVRIQAQDAPLPAARVAPGAARLLPAHTAPFRFDMVGIHWRGGGSVRFRVATAAGAWSAWHDARPEREDLPDRESGEASAAGGWKLGNPFWTGPATRIQYRTTGGVSRIRGFFVWSPIESAPRVAARETRPPIISRRGWGANERIVRARPLYAGRIAFAVVHHTAGGQPSTPAESAAIVRGIQTYHVKANGWNDIGYNFLVDRFGQIFEGRGGGITRNVVGAHAQGFNTGSVGVAVLGTYTSSSISPGARAALVALLSWRLDRAHVNPVGKVAWRSGGNPRFPAGRKVLLRRISGHRDTGFTDCPGDALHAALPGIAAEVRALGLPKIYKPRRVGTRGGPVRFRATVDPARPWTVVVTDAAGATVASGHGTGRALDWTWDATEVPAGTYRWTMSAGTARVVTGRIGAPPLRLIAAGVTPAVLSPNGDGFHDGAALRWQTTVPAQVRVRIRTPDGHVLANAMRWRWFGAGARSAVWNGAAASGATIPDGAYTLRFLARTALATVHEDVPVVIDRTLGSLAVSPTPFSPNGDGRRDLLRAGFSLSRNADVVVRVFRGKARIATVRSGPLAAGPQTVTWDGTVAGTPLDDGRYRLVVAATTGLGTRGLARRFDVDTTPPTITALRAVRTVRGTRVRFTLSEPGPVIVWFDATGVRLEAEAGVVRLRRRLAPERVRVRSWDAAGNRSRLEHVAPG